MIESALIALITQCAPMVAPDTMISIIYRESAGDPLAINVNGERKRYQAKSLEEAVEIATKAVKRNRTVDVGLAQVNSRNLEKMGIPLRKAFDPCINLEIGGKILHESYLRARRKGHDERESLGMAISAYNTGSFSKGFKNGYVAGVYEMVPSISATGKPEKLRKDKDKKDKPLIVRVRKNWPASGPEKGMRVEIDRSRLSHEVGTSGSSWTEDTNKRGTGFWDRPYFR